MPFDLKKRPPKPGQRFALPHTRREFVRRLTPIECERLHGLPDDWTNIPWQGKTKAPQSLRYAALGNSMAVPVMRWLGLRLSRVMAESAPYRLPEWV